MNDIASVKCKKCCVPSCKDKVSTRHRFPRPNDEIDIFNIWVANINNPLINTLPREEILKKSFCVCDRHFEESFKVPSIKRGLRRDAVPTLFLEGYGEAKVDDDFIPRKIRKLFITSETHHTTAEEDYDGSDVSKDNITKRSTSTVPITYKSQLRKILEMGLPPKEQSQHPNMGPTVFEEIFVPGSPRSSYTPNSSNFKMLSASEIKKDDGPTLNTIPKIGPTIFKAKRKHSRKALVCKQNELTPRYKKLYKMVQDWCMKTIDILKKKNSFEERLALANKVAESENFSNLLTRVNDHTCRLIIKQICTQKFERKAQRFTLDEKMCALSILKASGKGYRLLSKIFALPSTRALANLLKELPSETEINKGSINLLHFLK